MLLVLPHRIFFRITEKDVSLLEKRGDSPVEMLSRVQALLILQSTVALGLKQETRPWSLFTVDLLHWTENTLYL